MAYTLYPAGVTGPSQYIGGSSEYHIDSKFSKTLGEEEARRRFEQKVQKYRDLGRVVEFSNAGVADEIYDLDADDSVRRDLFRRATAAHAERPGFYSLDYYAPLKGDTRWDKSAEGAPIFAVSSADGRRETATGGNYGFHSIIYDKDGNVTAKVGHGDSRYLSLNKTSMPVGSALDPSTPSPNIDQQVPAPVDYSSMTKNQINAEYDKLRMAGDVFKAEKEGRAMHKAYFRKN